MRFLKRGWYDHELERMKAASEPQPALFKYYATVLLDEGTISLGKFCQLMGKDLDSDRADRYLHCFRMSQVFDEQE